MANKHKFRIGQVVAIRNGYMRQGQYFRITGFRKAKDNNVEALFGKWDSAVTFALRPLTKREKGQVR